MNVTADNVELKLIKEANQAVRKLTIRQPSGLSLQSKEYDRCDEELTQKLQDISQIANAQEEGAQDATRNNLFSNMKIHARNRASCYITSDVMSLNDIRSTVDLKEELGNLAERPDARLFDLNESRDEMNSLDQSQIQFYDDNVNNSFHMSKLHAPDTLR